MRLFRFSLFFWGLMFFTGSSLLFGQIEQAAHFSHRLEPASGFAEGDVVTLRIEVLIDPGYHMYSAKQVEAMQMMAATFDLDEEAAGIEKVGPLTDQGHVETAYDEIFENDLSLYHDAVTYLQQVKITATKPKLVGYLRYQVCDDSQCIPGTYDLSMNLTTVVKQEAPAPAPPVQEAPTKEPKPEARQSKTEPQVVPEKTETVPELPKIVNNDPARFVDAVDWDVTYDPAGTPKVGDIVTLNFSAKIDPGFHIYSSIPPKEPAGLPTTFNFNGRSRGIELVGDLQEAGDPIKKFDEIFETDVILFHDEVTFSQEFNITEENPVLEAYLSYQVCDDGACVNEKVEILESWGQPIPELGETETAKMSAADAEKGEEDPLWLTFLKGFIFGLASLFTPCIFPMIPLTVSFFTKQNKNRSQGIRNAIFYGLSIVFIYTFLGLMISIIFGGDAMRQLGVNPWMNLIFFAMIFAFALSFLGMFEIMLPGSWSSALDKKSGRGGLVGIFIMALTLAIVSFSCTGPLVSTALVEASRGISYLEPTIVMLGFSSALALPFALFAVFPGWLNSLPRSGGWLNSVKVVLGFLELALAMIYLSRADLVWHLGLLDREIFLGAWIVIFSMLGLYLLGKLRLPHDSPVEKVSVPRLLLAMCSFWFVLYLVPGLWGAELRMLGGYLPSDSSNIGVKLSTSQQLSLSSSTTSLTSANQDICSYPDKVSEHLSKDSPKGFCAFYDLDQGLAYAKSVNKPVFLDFTGHTCANCRYLEQNMWVDPEIRRLINEEYVLISLYTDDSQKLPKVEISSEGKKIRTVGDKWIQHELNTYGSNAQPLYVLLDHEQNELMPPSGFDPPLDVEWYQKYFQEGLKKFKAGK
ncbi:MAG: protein-disulfide reductase DsbD domain-containing protein [Bacteroidota bacterium]